MRNLRVLLADISHQTLKPRAFPLPTPNALLQPLETASPVGAFGHRPAAPCARLHAAPGWDMKDHQSHRGLSREGRTPESSRTGFDPGF